MAITLNKIEYENLNFTKLKGEDIWELDNDAKIIAYYTKKNQVHKMTLNLKKGFKTDGASVPKLFQWFLPKWDKKNTLYNCAAIIHDCLYTTKGCNGSFTREECDDFFRGGIRIAGVSRFKAGVADKCLEWFASSPKHWGDDNLKNKKNNLIIINIE